ncbi:MAG: flippase [Methanobacterium sp.]
MSTVRRLVRNTTLLMFSQILSFIIAFIYTVFMARYLGVNDFGLLSFALALVSVIGIFADLGLNTLMTREISRNKSSALKYVNNVFSVKIILLSTLLVATALIINLLGYPQKTIYTIYLVIFSLVGTTFSGMFYALFQAYENLKYQSIGTILSSFLMLIGVLIAIHYKLNVVEFALIYFIVGMMVFIYCLYITSKNFILPKIGFNSDFDKEMIQLALQFGLIGIFSTVYVWIDSVMLFLMQGSYAVGLYNVAYRIVLVLLFIPIVINSAIFPVMSRMYGKFDNPLKKIVEKYFKLMVMIGVPLGVGGTLLSDKIILLIFGTAYVGSVPALQILIWATVFTFANAAFVQLFQATNRQMLVTKITGIGMIENIILNLAIIPTFSFIGASIDTLITEFTVASLLIVTANRTKYSLKGKFSINIIKITISSLIMGVFIFLFHNLNLFVLIIISTLIYMISIYLIGAVDKEDKDIISKIFN